MRLLTCSCVKHWHMSLCRNTITPPGEVTCLHADILYMRALLCWMVLIGRMTCSGGREMYRMFTPCSLAHTHAHTRMHTHWLAVIMPPQVSDTLKRKACWAYIRPAEKQEATPALVRLTSNCSQRRICWSFVESWRYSSCSWTLYILLRGCPT